LTFLIDVSGWRRFAGPDKGFAKQRPGLAKCGGAKPLKGRSPTAVLRSLAARTGRRTVTVCYVPYRFINTQFLTFFLLIIGYNMKQKCNYQ
jgi:hypothetical protein